VHKLNRIGPAIHVSDDKISAAGTTSYTGTSAFAATVPFLVINTALADKAQMAEYIRNAGTFTFTGATKGAYGQQFNIARPNADAYAVELWGSISLFAPANCIIRPVAGLLDEAGTALLEQQTLRDYEGIGPIRQDMGAASTNVYQSWYYHSQAVFQGDEGQIFGHGFEILNINAADAASVSVGRVSCGFRTLDASDVFAYYDSVR